jgi:NhaP-type Na+/H+ or K+/H+ antiporter
LNVRLLKLPSGISLVLMGAMAALTVISTLKIMTWGGVRGGISVALALSLPFSPYKNSIVAITFVIVLFSILV